MEGETDKPTNFFKGKPIEYSAKDKNLSMLLILRNPERSEWKRGVDYYYEAEVQVAWNNGGMCKSKTGWTHHAYTIKDNGSLGGIFDEIVDYANVLTDLLRSRIGNERPSNSSLIRLIHSIQDQVKSDFLQPREGMTSMRPDLLEKYFKQRTPCFDDD